MKQEKTTMQTKEGLHTPEKWVVSGRGKGNDPYYIQSDKEDGFAIAEIIVAPHLTIEEAKANAELIVKAVNERQALLDAKELYEEYIEYCDTLIEDNEASNIIHFVKWRETIYQK